MTFEQAMLVLDLVLQQKHLSDIQELVLRQSWEGYTYAQIAERSGYDDDYIRDVGYRLWQMLSRALGENVNKSNIKSVLRRRYVNLQPAEVSVPTLIENPVGEKQPKTSLHQDWGEAIDVSVFYGRRIEQSKLQQWILNDRCRLLALLGMGGIGKTALSVKLAEQLQDNFDYVIWRSLRNAPPIVELLKDIIAFVSEGEAVNIPETVEAQISGLMNYLAAQRCLIVLDNVESVLATGTRSGRYRLGYEGYGQLLRRVGDERHQSCLLITSREKPIGFTAREGDNLPVRSLQLTGLPEVAARQILLTKGLVNSPDEFDNLIQRYTGNPLALKIVATTIQRLFDGNIQAFLTQGAIVFGDIWQILDQQFSRLSVNEQQLMYWLAIKREWVTIPELEADIIPQISKRELLEALLSLQGRSLIEQQSGSYTQQPVVMEYMIDKLIKQVCQEILSGEINLYNTYALMEATAKDYVSESQKRVILAPILNSLNIIWNNPATITRRLQEIISLLRSKFASIPGYAAGNTINLLRQLNVDFTGWDFSGLTIWQADLQNMNLYQVNFSNSDLRKSNFHQALVNILTVQFSPDGQVLVTGDANGSVRLWNIADGQQLQHLEGHTGWVWQANFSQNGQTLASCCENGMIKLWDVNTGQCLHSYHQQSIRSWLSSFSPDNQILASTSREQTIKLWDIHRGECIKIFSEDTHKIGPVAFSPDGQILASGNENQTIKLWDVNTGECLSTLDGHHQAIWSVSFSPDGQILASGSEDKTVKLWDVSTGRCWQTLQGSQIDLVWAIAFSPDGKSLAIAGEAATITIWDLNTGKCIKTLSGHSTRVWSIAFSPDGQILASGAEDQSIRLWEVNTGRCIKTFHGYPIFTGAVAFSPDGESLASSTGHTVKLWDLVTGNLVKNLPGHSRDVMALAYNTDGNTLASGSLDGSIRLWNLNSGECDKTLLEHSSFIFALNYSPNGHRLASGSADKTIKIWDVATGQCLHTLTGHTGWVFSVVWSLDGRFLASMGENSIHLWDATTGENLQVLPGQYCLIGAVAFHPNGQLLATGDNQEYKIQFWDIHTGNSWQTVESHKTTITDVKFSPNGDRVASGSHDKTIKIWHSQTGEYLQTLQGHSNWIWAIAFHPQGQILASGSQDETVRLWDIATGECLQILRSPRPYEGMKIQGVTGLTPAQKATLKILGARD